MSDVTIERLELQVSSDSTSAAKGIDELSSSLRRLREAVAPVSKGGMGLGALSNSLNKFSQSIANLSGLSIAKENIAGLVDALKPLEGVQKSGFNSLATGLDKLVKVAPKIDQVTQSLRNTDLDAFANECERVAQAIRPLASEMEKVAAGFSAFPAKIQKLLNSNAKLSASNKGLSTSYVNLAAKIAIAVTAIKRVASTVAGWIAKSNEYVEDLNLFTVAMGSYAGEAQEFANTVGDIMGIDPADWMRNQGIFMTLATGFGVASDSAYVMSQNLTQLGYDLSSFFNISYEDAMLKLQSGLAGELEPLRRLGYDLSNARLQQEAYALGIEKKVTAMTQAEKAELRYYTIMTQVTAAQGDMARTLETPANQLRILKSQVEQAGRALGNIFIPMLNAVLPYAIAVAKVVRMLADAIANLFGFALPQIDYDGLGSAVGGAGDLTDNLDAAGKKAKEVKKALLGIDELNIISPKDDSSGSGSDALGGGGLGIELPTYDFLGDAVAGRVAEIVERMKEWLGLTEDIDTWGEFFHTKLGRILTTVGAIAVGLAAWKLSNSLITGIDNLQTMLSTGISTPLKVAAGISLIITGITLEGSGIADAIQNELNGMNFTQILGGGTVITGGGAFLGKTIAGWITTAFADSAVAGALATAATNLSLGSAGAAGAALGAAGGGIIAGIPAFIAGIYDAVTKGIDWLSATLVGVGATAGGAGIGTIIGALGGPIGAGIGALIGLAIGLVTDGIILIVQKWDMITAWWNGTALPFIKSIPSKIASLIQSIGQWFSELPGKIGYALGFALGSVVKWVIDTHEMLQVKIPEIIEAVRTWFAQLPSKIWNAIVAAKDKLVIWATAMIAKAKVVIPQIIDAIIGFFKEIPQKLADLGKDIWNGLIDGLKNGWSIVKNGISDFVGQFIGGFKSGLGIHSPSRVFQALGEYTIEGYNLGIESLGSSTKGVVNKWVESFSSVSPVMSFAVDTSALKYYGSDSFARSVSANVASSTSVDASSFKEGMEEFYREYIEPTMAQMAADMRRQADKSDRTTVQIGNRVVYETVTTQQKANGYVFAK